MSRTIIRGGGGVETDIPFAGTDPIVVPRDRDPDWDSGIITDVTSGSKSLTHNLNTAIANLDIVVMFRRTSDQTWQRFDSQLYHVSGSNYGFSLGGINLNTIALFIADSGPIILTNSFATLAGAVDAFRVEIWKRTDRLIYLGGPQGLRETWCRFKLNDVDIIGSGGGVTFSNFTILQKEGPGAKYLSDVGAVLRFTAPYKGKLDVMTPMFTIDVIPGHYGDNSMVHQFNFGSPVRMRKWVPDRKIDAYTSFPSYDVWGILNEGEPFAYVVFSGTDFRIEWQRWGYNSADSPSYGWWEMYFRELTDVDG
jgi:hypothetical protein